jgi:hypothetical protein
MQAYLCGLMENACRQIGYLGKGFLNKMKEGQKSDNAA